MTTYPTPALGDIPFDGTVATLPLPVALERVFRARATGVLALEGRPGRHVVYLRDGYPVAVELPGALEVLGKVLVEMKILDEATHQQTLSTPLPPGTRYGEVLLAQKLVTEEQLRLALKAQARRKLHRLYFLSDASISFAPGIHEEGLQNNEPLRVHPWRANYHGVRSAWNAERLRQALGALFSRPLHTALTAEELARFGLGPEDGRVGVLLRGGCPSVDALAIDSGLPIQPVSALVYALYVAEALDDGTAGQPAVVAAAPPSTSPPAASPPPGANPAASELERLVAERLPGLAEADLFSVLRVDRGASPEQIKNAYLDAARRFHPDRLAALGLPHLRADVEKIFRRLSEAQATLLDDARRAAYLGTLDDPKSGAETAAQRQALAALQAEVAFKRGQHLLKKNEFASALRDFEAAVADHPDEAEYIVYLAWTRYCTQQLPLAEALAQIQAALHRQPRCASAHYYVGMLHKEKGDEDAALASFRKALSLDERQFDAEQEIRLLESRRARQVEKRGLFDRFRKRS